MNEDYFGTGMVAGFILAIFCMVLMIVTIEPNHRDEVCFNATDGEYPDYMQTKGNVYDHYCRDKNNNEYVKLETTYEISQ